MTMQIIGNLFTIALFTTLIGSIFTLALLFIQRVLRFAPPLWFGALGALAYLVPCLFPGLRLIPPEVTIWIEDYLTACCIWAVGAVLLGVFFALRACFAYKKLGKFIPCEDTRILDIYGVCGRAVSMGRLPRLLWGGEEPACVITVLRPAILLNPNIAADLNEKELTAVLLHELSHVKRKHHFLQRLYDVTCCVNWFNPLAWVARSEFAMLCEMDCDAQTIDRLSGNAKGYAATMLRLMELTAPRSKAGGYGMKALGFLLVKQRFYHILLRPNKLKKAIVACVLAMVLVVTICFSLLASRTHFYPYPALMGEAEISAEFLGD